jgi:hypothetical protein
MIFQPNHKEEVEVAISLFQSIGPFNPVLHALLLSLQSNTDCSWALLPQMKKEDAPSHAKVCDSFPHLTLSEPSAMLDARLPGWTQ